MRESEAKKYRLTIPFIRYTAFSVDTLALLCVDSEFDNQADTVDALIRAVTAWVKQTSEGAACWNYSVEDLNIGDLLGWYDASPLLNGYLTAAGVTLVSAALGEVGDCIPFDKVLVDSAALDEGCDDA